jgi:hypothetical protein
MTHYNRIIGYFDLLGFRNLVMTRPLPEIIARFGQVCTALGAAAVRHEVATGAALRDVRKRYSGIAPHDLSGIRRAFEASTGFSLLMMSDSVLFYSQPINAEDDGLRREISAAIRISRTIALKLFEEIVPPRGALAYGELYVDVENSIIAGRGLVEAYEVADSQDWIGVAVAPSLEQFLSEMDRSFTDAQYAAEPWVARPRWDYVTYDIPFKKERRRGYVVNFASAWNFGGAVRDDFFADHLTGDDSIDIKYHNTLQFLKHWHSQGE